MGYRDSINKVLDADLTKATAQERDTAAKDVIKRSRSHDSEDKARRNRPDAEDVDGQK